MKTTTLGIAIGTAIAALGLAITAVPEAKAGGVYWNNKGGGGSSSIAAPPTVPAVITTTDRTITEVAVLLQVPMVPGLAVTTVALDASVTDPSINSKSSDLPRPQWRGFLFAKTALISLDNPPAN